MTRLLPTAIALLFIVWPACKPAESPVRIDRTDRIVSLAPNATEILFELGAGDRVVGVTTACNYPPRVRSLPKVGGFMDSSFEAIVQLKPDLVVTAVEATRPGLLDKLARVPIAVLAVPTRTTSEIKAGVEKIAQVIGVPQRARSWIESTQSGIARVQERVGDVRPRRVLFVVGHDPLAIAGGGTFIDELIQIAGGLNVAKDAATPYPSWPLEQVILSDPEVILETAMSMPDHEAALRFWSRWPSIAAVREDRVLSLVDDALVRPGPRIVQAAERLAAVIHPEIFAPPSVR